MKWFERTTPEEQFKNPELEYYILNLKSGGIIGAERVNGYWFGMWRWIRDEEVDGWTYLV